MHSQKSSIFKRSGLLLLFLGIFLICSNTIGLYYFRTVEPSDPFVTNPTDRKLSADEFWEKIAIEQPLGAQQYAERLTQAISERILFVPTEYAQLLHPTFFENWIIWLYSLNSTYYQWIDPEKAIRLGGGMCSQCAIIFNKIMNSKGYSSVILRLNGHVLNEVVVDGKLLVYDADFNINFNKTLQKLADDPELLHRAYIQRGVTEEDANTFTQAFVTMEDNSRIRFADKYAAAGTMQHIIEPASFYLIWIIPIFSILLGLKILSSPAAAKPESGHQFLSTQKISAR
ncbi:MAG: hypothetical protein Q3M24_06655 [Candidatus Electrothrix aestuarii]|uniref:Transglutaminase-like superfamily protein n=1 Tax=Candidatus Electrothrix aestuarii TaxID=3062594 RepID=A0AAU8LYX7_9BACT|nr:hypothetical protein [Candidatus Electrothrix aestuarii]